MKTSVQTIVFLILLFIYSCSGNHPTLKNQSSISVNEIKPDTSKHDYLKLGYELMQKEKFNNLRLGLKPDSIKILIGDPDEITAPTEWAAFGSAFQSYTYTSLGLKLDLILSPDSSFTVKMITIQFPCDFKSSKGIGINSSYEDVKMKYHHYIDPSSADTNNIVAGSVYGGILFKFANKKVKSIFIGEAAD